MGGRVFFVCRKKRKEKSYVTLLISHCQRYWFFNLKKNEKTTKKPKAIKLTGSVSKRSDLSASQSGSKLTIHIIISSDRYLSVLH